MVVAAVFMNIFICFWNKIYSLPFFIPEKTVKTDKESLVSFEKWNNNVIIIVFIPKKDRKQGESIILEAKFWNKRIKKWIFIPDSSAK